MLHSDCDGEWGIQECKSLQAELLEVAVALKAHPAANDQSEWQKELFDEMGRRPDNRYDEFIDVDGESLVTRLSDLCACAIQAGRPIFFQ